MAIRKLPFGYHIQNGRVCIADREAEVVRAIFHRYAECPSYDRLAEELNGQDVPYAPGKQWNKSMVARILRDGRYLGGSEHPQIIMPETFQRAKAAKPDAAGTISHPEIKDIRILARCGLCRGPMRRERKDYWRCPHCMGSPAHIKDEYLMLGVDRLLRRLRDQPDIADPSPAPDTEYEGEAVQQAQASLAAELDKPAFDEDAAQSAALALAAARFDALGSQDYETMRIRYALDHTERADGLDTALLRQIAAAVLIHPTGAVSLQLKNRQIIERSASV